MEVSQRKVTYFPPLSTKLSECLIISPDMGGDHITSVPVSLMHQVDNPLLCLFNYFLKNKLIGMFSAFVHSTSTGRRGGFGGGRSGAGTAVSGPRKT